MLVADDKQEKLITMDSPEDDPVASQFLENITIPSALITRDFGDSLKKALNSKEMVSIKIDWRESLPHPDKRVEYESGRTVTTSADLNVMLRLNLCVTTRALPSFLSKVATLSSPRITSPGIAHR